MSALSTNSTRAAAATSTADAAGTVAADGRPRPWYRQIRLDAVWTAILLVPLFFVITDDMPVLHKTVGAAGILGFAGLYIWATTTMPTWPILPKKMSALDELRPIAGRFALLAVVAAVSGPGLDWWYTVFYLPYFCAIIMYATTLRVGLPLSGCLCLLTVVVFALFAPRANIAGMAAGCSFSSVAIALGRIGADVQERRQVKERELAAAAEREEIGRDVHDLLGHSLTVLTLKAEVAHRLVRRSPEAAERELAEIVELSRAALADVRATVTRLRVPDLAGQMEASRTAFAAADIAAAFTGRAGDVPLPQRELLAWALREATTNVLRHAGAARVNVELAPGRVRVQDDGAGIAGHRPGNGLTGLRERVEAAGGTLVLTSPAPGGNAARPGTVLEVIL
ncbi:histidine kinase [Actinomyces massiliensis]|uniref:sensor histidine kinase n=1 Tax=Actinomyces massiliensis TaxID=461393 RepID=UPI0028EBF97F|nr:histidine kinase [Actinomyces massiliensis]